MCSSSLNIRYFVYFGPLTIPHGVNVMTPLFFMLCCLIKKGRINGGRLSGPLTSCIYFTMISKSTLWLAFAASEYN